jgi:hypothetical protein
MHIPSAESRRELLLPSGDFPPWSRARLGPAAESRRIFMGNLSKQGSAMLSSFLTLVGTGEENLSRSPFTGTWLVKDTSGNPFEITLFGSGTAEANRASEGMTGTWTEDGPSAVITWDTGWTTKITKIGNEYIKTAYDQTAAAPTNTSIAEKVED